MSSVDCYGTNSSCLLNCQNLYMGVNSDPYSNKYGNCSRNCQVQLDICLQSNNTTKRMDQIEKKNYKQKKTSKENQTDRKPKYKSLLRKNADGVWTN